MKQLRQLRHDNYPFGFPFLHSDLRGMNNLGQIFQCGPRDNETALISAEGVHFTYRECRQLVQDFQNLIKFEISSTVTVMYPNCVDFVIAFIGLCGLNVPVNPLNPKYTAEEIKFYMADSESQALLIPSVNAQHHAGFEVCRELGADVWTFDLIVSDNGSNKKIVLNKLAQFRKTRKVLRPFLNGVALILHTSGTTSKPKGVPLTHENICRTISNVINTYQLTCNDRSLVVMPLFHVHGLIGALLSSLAARGSAVVCAFSASNFWKLFLEHNCSWYSAVPTIHQILLKHEKDVGELSKRGRLRFIRSCSSSLPPSVFKQLEETYGVPVLEAYAMTEAAHQMTSNPLPPLKRKPGSVGLPQGVQVRIINGEVCVRGTNVTRGYINRPEANKESFLEGGWFRTGDQGYKDEEGYVFLTGRLKELINRGGEKIAPLEIDHVLLGVKGVSEAVCFGVKDKVYGEEVHAAVVLRSDAKGVTEESLKKHCQSHLASFKVPKKIYIVDQVPKTPTGKVQRRFVAAHFAGDGKKEKSKL